MIALDPMMGDAPDADADIAKAKSIRSGIEH
jgi:hypothetical protein